MYTVNDAIVSGLILWLIYNVTAVRAEKYKMSTWYTRWCLRLSFLPMDPSSMYRESGRRIRIKFSCLASPRKRYSIGHSKLGRSRLHCRYAQVKCKNNSSWKETRKSRKTFIVCPVYALISFQIPIVLSISSTRFEFAIRNVAMSKLVIAADIDSSQSVAWFDGD